MDVAQSRKNAGWHAYCMVGLVATLAVVPIAFHGNPWGHDVNLHLRSWMDAERQFHEGNFFPRWAAGANQGFGEPFFIFYPPLSRLVGVALGLVLPWKIVSGVYIWLMLVLAGAAMWICAREWLAPADALVASLLFAVNPYLLIVAYKRGNYADLLAGALFPLLVWGGMRMGYAPARTALPLSAAFAAIWLSDLPAAVVASYALAGLLVLNAILYRSLRPLLLRRAGHGVGVREHLLFPLSGGLGAKVGEHRRGRAPGMGPGAQFSFHPQQYAAVRHFQPGAVVHRRVSDPGHGGCGSRCAQIPAGRDQPVAFAYHPRSRVHVHDVSSQLALV